MGPSADGSVLNYVPHNGTYVGTVLEPITKPRWTSLFKTNENEINNGFKLDHIDLSAFRGGRLLKVPNTISDQGKP